MRPEQPITGLNGWGAGRSRLERTPGRGENLLADDARGRAERERADGLWAACLDEQRFDQKNRTL